MVRPENRERSTRMFEVGARFENWLVGDVSSWSVVRLASEA
jgi:hypothetical protein